MSKARDHVLGLIPAAGYGTRLGALPCSKEVLPVAWEARADGLAAPRVAAAGLLEGLQRAGVERAFVVLREGKWDVPGHLGSGRAYGLDLGYLLVEDSTGVAATLDAAYPFVARATVAFGFPDIWFRPTDALARLLERLDEGRAEVVLGVFPADEPSRSDLVRIDADGRVAAVEIKPATSDLAESWALAVWTPRFSAFMHAWLAQRRPDAGESHLGHVFAAALATLRLEAVRFPAGAYIDIGTPDALRRVARGWA